MDELRVPKRPIQVDLTPASGATRKVEVYLSEFAHHHEGGERLSELLNTGGFLPARDLERQKVAFFNCAALAVVRVATEVEADDDAAAHTIPTEHEVEVTLVGGQTLRGLLSYALPPERSRLIDYLGTCEQFIPLIEQDHLALINRDYVAQIEVLGG
jgi:hypothetical protein